jgi:hypothetical protein
MVTAPTPSIDGAAARAPPVRDLGDIDLEIVGLNSATNGRSCSQHPVCGQEVKVGDILRLVECIVEVNGQVEDAVKCVRIMDGSDGCTVAFIPRAFMKVPKLRKNINKFAIVKEVYKDSDSTYKRRKSQKNLEMAGVVLLSEITRDE